MKIYKSLIALALIAPITLSKKVNASDIDDYGKKEVVVALTNVNVREEPSINSKKIGLLWGTESIDLISIENDDWYKVDYYGTVGYVSSDYVMTTTNWDVTTNPNQVGYLNKDVIMTSWDVNDNRYEDIISRKNEVGYIIESNNDRYTMLVGNTLLSDISSDYVQEVDLNNHNYPSEVEKILIRIRHERDRNK